MKIILFIICLFYNLIGYSQFKIEDIHEKSKEHTFNGMIAFNSWTYANIIGNTIGYFNSSGEMKYFCEMNVFFNIINAGIGMPGLIGAIVNKKKKPFTSFEATYKEINKLKIIYLVNGVLDLSYITAGFLFREIGRNNNSEQFSGFGNSFIMQGAFLLIYDFIMFGIHSANGKKLNPFWKSIKINPIIDNNSIGLNFNINLNMLASKKAPINYYPISK